MIKLIKMDIEAQKWEIGYLICVACIYDAGLEYIELYSPQDISSFFNIDINEYYEKMIREFNAHLNLNLEIYFDHEEGCKKAIDWLNSIYIMNKLTK